MLRDHEKEIHSLKLLVENNGTMLSRMGEMQAKDNVSENNIITAINKILEKIPINDTVCFEEVNALLSANVELFKDFVSTCNILYILRWALYKTVW